MYLTPNRRLAIFVSKQYIEDALPFKTWLETVWEQIQKEYPGQYPTLLTSAEQEIVWEKIIQTAQADTPLLRISSTAKLACEAWNLSHHWQVSWLNCHNITEDSHAYYKWAKSYQLVCQKNHWIDSANLLAHIIDLINQGILEPPPHLNCIGFEEWTPQQDQFLESCRRKGSHIEFRSLVSDMGAIFRLPVRSKDEELTAAVKASQRWLKDYPLSRIGIIIPDLEYRRFEVERVFKEQLLDDVFNIAAPLSLFEYPLIQSILLGLKLMLREISLETISQYLRLPFFGQAITEAAERAAIEVLLRDGRREKYTLESLIIALEFNLKKLPEGCCFHLLENLKELAALRTSFKGKQSAEMWKELSIQLLRTLGWPGERALNFEENQLKEQWELLLAEYVQMDRVLGNHYYSEALQYIQRLFQLKKFLPTSQLGAAPIQVLGLLEALGLPFDYVWVVGLHRDTWPTDPSPNPYIPLAMQRSLGLPRSSAARELQVAKRITQQLCLSAKMVIFCYPKMVEDHLTSVSPLLAQYPECSIKQLEQLGLCAPQKEMTQTYPSIKHAELSSEKIISSTTSEMLATSSIFEYTKDTIDTRSFLDANGDSKTQALTLGGARVLKLQATCPFRAFAEIRLKAKPLTSLRLGLNAAERGEILHQCLLAFWEGLKDQNELIALSSTECWARIDSVITVVFDKWQTKYPHLLTPQYRLLEQERTEALIQKFVELEKTRPFFEVVGSEIEQTIVLSGIQLKFRIDRVDRLETGEELLIDYKTGNVHISEWFGSRPADPQLPLYCIARRPTPLGVAFAIIRPDAMKFQGLGVDGECLPGMQTPLKAARYGSAETWDEQYSIWEKDMERLAYEFRIGKTDVDPVEGEKTCKNCHLKTLCRIQNQ